ncbi:TetR/AcrR family transcriptional regulator [Exiguobacterium flavidum]|uniref:TetR/AcrR family transcriptional regulator n=1 Tax=Exiguobacterium flavidum TaxID=2184695 RepID=UPI001300B035|nr:TetR/AcrR family transcriptional regulator [Exiguobacterium flavidum]
MNQRKQAVLTIAHRLFIEQGFQATSIQDILEYSGIAKGTFYNYFASKNELLIEIFKMTHKKMEHLRDDMLSGQDASDIELFIRQIELQMKENRHNKLFALFEEMMVSQDDELRQFIRNGQLRWVQWIYERFIDLFGEHRQPYLLDTAISFVGILQSQMKYHQMAEGMEADIAPVIRYSVARAVEMVEEVEATGDQLLDPAILGTWLPNCRGTRQAARQRAHQLIFELKKEAVASSEREKVVELLDFIQEELLETKQPRRHVLESTLAALEAVVPPGKIEPLLLLCESYYEERAIRA